MWKRNHKSGETGIVSSALKREDGNIAVLAAGLLSFLTATTVVSVDAGSMHYKQKELQRIADEAALAASLAPNRGLEVAMASLRANGLDDKALQSVRVGGYSALPQNGVRFSPGSGSNAVEVVLNGRASLPFLAMLGGSDSVDIAAVAVAANIPEVGFSARSGLVDFSLTNRLLGGVGRASLDLSDAEFLALADQDINILELLDEIAVLTGSRAGNFNELLGERVSAATVFAALVNIMLADASASGIAIGAAEKLAAENGFGNLFFRLDQLVNLSTLAARAVGEGNRRTDATSGFPALDVIVNTVHVAGRGKVLDLGATPSVPGVFQGRIYVELDDGALAGGSPGNAPLVVGPAGTSMHVSSGRILFDLQLLGGDGLLSGSELKIPVYVELSGGDVMLSDVECGTDPSKDTQMTFSATASFGRAYIADVTLNDMKSGRDIVNPDPVDILTIGSLTASGYAELELLGSGDQQVTFSMADIEQGNTAFVGDEQITGTLFDSLFSNLYLDINSSGTGGRKGGLTGLGVTDKVVERVTLQILSSMSRTLDPLISGVLASLGLRAGYTELGPTDVRCGTPVIVS